jgi:glutathione synthase
MDPIHTIHPKKDSSLGLLIAAQARGWSLMYMELNDLLLDQEQPKAYMRPLTVRDHDIHWFELGIASLYPLHMLSTIIMRKDPPVDQAYLHATQILMRAHQEGTPVINHPQSLSHYNEKLFALEFQNCCPPTLVTQSIQAAQQFLNEYHDIIVKPLDGMGGQSIFRVRHNDPNKAVIFETLAQRAEAFFLLQRYIPDIIQGDKRIIMINGEPIPYALARLPASGETRANLAVGGKGVAVPLTNRDLEICAQVGPILREKGLLWVGLDIIGPYLTEINITSPTCVRELENQKSLNINHQLLDCISQQIM